jgi:hypothetical protein
MNGIFSSIPDPKNAGAIHFMFRGRLVSRILENFQQPAILTKIVQHFGAFFHQIKVCKRIGRKDSYNLFSGSDLLKNSRSKLKFKIPIAMVPLSCRTNLAGRYTFYCKKTLPPPKIKRRTEINEQVGSFTNCYKWTA